MPKSRPSAPGGHQNVEDHPSQNMTTVSSGKEISPRARGEAALRGYEGTPELMQVQMDHDADKADAISNMFRKK